MNRTKEQWAAARGIPQAAICDEAQQDIAELHARIEGLEATLKIRVEQVAETALNWRREQAKNRELEAAHQKLIAERDALMKKHNALHISARKDRDERDALRAHIFTNTDRSMTMDGRVFSLRGDGFICDNKFDFDAGLRVSGDFVDEEIQRYAGMIASVLNEHLALRAQVEVISNKYESLKQLQQLKAIERGQPK